MPSVYATPLPENSLLHRFISPGDFCDCFATQGSVPLREAAHIATSFPAWVQGLLALRNAIVTPFGLASSGEHSAKMFGIFPLVDESENELILGFDDKHLDFRVSLISDGQMVSMATWVKTHNLGGKIYLNTIMPFHKLIVRNCVARVAQAYPPLATA